MGDPSNPSQIKEPKSVGGGRSIKPEALDELRNRRAASELGDRAQRTEEALGAEVGDPSNPRNRREALDDGGDEGGVEVELEMVAGEHGRGVQRLEHASRDSEAVV